MDNYYWVESATGLARIMIATRRTLKIGQVNKGDFVSANCGNPCHNPMVLEKAMPEEVADYLSKKHLRSLISQDANWNRPNAHMVAFEKAEDEKNKHAYHPRTDGLAQEHKGTYGSNYVE